jgi:hypothetical protein
MWWKRPMAIRTDPRVAQPGIKALSPDLGMHSRVSAVTGPASATGSRRLRQQTGNSPQMELALEKIPGEIRDI